MTAHAKIGTLILVLAALSLTLALRGHAASTPSRLPKSGTCSPGAPCPFGPPPVVKGP